MKTLLKPDPRVKESQIRYPNHAKASLAFLKQLILDCAEELDSIQSVEESLKWGEASYKSNIGSPIRMDWKEKKPEQYALYFSCSSTLVSTFREIYGPQLKYEKNRALLFSFHEAFPLAAVKNCIKLALEYHIRKKRPLLGYQS